MRIFPGLFVVASSLFDSKRPPAFGGAARVTLTSPGALPPVIDVFCRDERLLRSHYDAAAGRAIYLWGRVAHPTVTGTAAVLKECADAAATSTASGLRQVYGTFVLVVEDRRARRVTFASDVLGVRPWFVRRTDAGLVAGSDVLALHDEGYSDGKLDYDAVSSWLRYNYDLTAGSVLEQYGRLAAGAVVVYDADGRVLKTTDYAAFAADSQRPSPQATVDGVHDRVRHAFGVLTRDLSAVTLPLSGGYDSRYLLALGQERRSMWTTAVNVASSPAESAVARQVADTLGQSVKVMPAGGHTLDLFEDPFFVTPGGFPAGRNLASAVARRHPGTPVLSGFLGDLLVRGSGDRCLDRLPDAFPQADHADAFSRHHAFKLNRLDLLRPGLAAAVRERSLNAARRLTAATPSPDKAFVYGNLFGRQRSYISYIFLQHLDTAEAVLPFYTWDLIDFKLRTAAECFAFDNYPRLFAAYRPELSAIPHASKVAPATPPKPNVTRHLRGWAASLLRDTVRRTGVPTLIDRRKLLRRLPGGLAAAARWHDELLFLYKVRLFEKNLARHNLLLDPTMA